jgi:hypothetical protein
LIFTFPEQMLFLESLGSRDGDGQRKFSTENFRAL